MLSFSKFSKKKKSKEDLYLERKRKLEERIAKRKEKLEKKKELAKLRGELAQLRREEAELKYGKLKSEAKKVLAGFSKMGSGVSGSQGQRAGGLTLFSQRSESPMFFGKGGDIDFGLGKMNLDVSLKKNKEDIRRKKKKKEKK